VSSDLDQLFHFGVSGILPGNRDLRALLGQPTSSPAHKIGGEDRKLLLEKESRGRADLQVVHGEHIFAFLDARLDGLASIVTVKPAGEIGGNRIMAEVQQRAVPDGLAGVETLQGYVNGIREIREAFVSPGQHLSIVAHLHPTSQRAHSPFQAGSEPIAVGFGIDLIAHFDQEGDVLSGTETSIQAKVSLNGVGIGAVFSLEGLQAVAQALDLCLQSKHLPLAMLQMLFQHQDLLCPPFLPPFEHLEALPGLGQSAVRPLPSFAFLVLSFVLKQ